MVFCDQCGEEMRDGAKFCDSCGAASGGAPEQSAAKQPSAAPVTARPSRGKTGGKRLKFILIAVVVVIGCCTVFWRLIPKYQEHNPQEANHNLFYNKLNKIITWTLTIPAGEYDYIQLEPEENGSAILIVHKYEAQIIRYIYMINSFGKIIFSKTIEDESYSPMSGKLTVDDGIITTGAISRRCATSNDDCSVFAVAKYNSIGEEIWRNTYFENYDVSAGISIAVTKDSKYLCAGFLRNFLYGEEARIHGNWTDTLVIFKFDMNGNIIWSYKKNGYTQNRRNWNVYENENGGAYFASNFDSAANIISLDNTGNLLWEKSITENDCSDNQILSTKDFNSNSLSILAKDCSHNLYFVQLRVGGDEIRSNKIQLGDNYDVGGGIILDKDTFIVYSTNKFVKYKISGENIIRTKLSFQENGIVRLIRESKNNGVFVMVTPNNKNESTAIMKLDYDLKKR
jgi:hypothetical protein